MYGGLRVGVEVGTSQPDVLLCAPVKEGETSLVVEAVSQDVTLAISSCINGGQFIIGFTGENIFIEVLLVSNRHNNI